MTSSSHLVSENKSCGVFAETSAHSAHAGLVLWASLRCGRLCLYPSGTSLWAEARDGGAVYATWGHLPSHMPWLSIEHR